MLYGGAGDDVLAVGDGYFARIDGGSGTDTLRLDGAGQALDLDLVGNMAITGIERIDLTGSGDNSVTLALTDLLQISDESDDLFVSGDTGDRVAAVGAWQNAGPVAVDGVVYTVFDVAGVAGSLYVEDDVAVAVGIWTACAIGLGGGMEFRVGAVLGRSLSILRRHFAVFGTLALMFTWPLIFVSDDSGVDSGAGVTVASGQAVAGLGVGAVVALIIAVALFALTLFLLASCTMVYGTFQALRELPVDIAGCIRRGMPAVPRVLGIAILSTLAVALVGGLLSVPGFMVLAFGNQVIGGILVFAAIAIPGLMIYAALWVAVPVAVVEGESVMNSMRRSARLTRGYRWRVFGIILAMAVLNAVVEGIALLPFDAGGTAYAIAGFIVTAIFTAWGAVAAAVAYHDLRLEKEGIDVNQIAAVFD